MAVIKNMTIKTPRGRRQIGPGQPVFIIAEMSGNHNQDIRRAYKIIDAAAAAGADAVKSQTYTADTITMNSDTEPFQIRNSKLWSGQTLYQLYQKAYTPWEWQPKLKKYAEAKGLVFFSTPFDNTAVDFLEKIKVNLYKVASFEVVDIPLLKRIGRTKKPVIMARGAATAAEIKLAIKTLEKSGCPQVAVLHCVSAYPAELADMNLKTIPDISRKFKVVSGLSDHTLGQTAITAAVALGASIVEKHITLKRSDGGPDAAFSLEAEELKQLVKSVREIEKALGQPKYGASSKSEAESAIFRKSLFVVKNIKRGEKFTAKNVRSIRPGGGLAPKYYDKIMGKRAKSDIKRATPLSWKLIL